MSQQGTPFGAITPLNQARISAGTFSYWPLSKASAVPAHAQQAASKAMGTNLRIRSSTRCSANQTMRLGPSSVADARSNNMRSHASGAAPKLMRREITSVPVLTFVSHRGGQFYECQNQRDTRNHMILVWRLL